MHVVRVSALALCLVALGGSSAFAAEPLRVHVATGAAQVVGGDQASQFGAGAAGTATVELPTDAHVGFQANGSAVVLAKGDPSKDPKLASTSTGAGYIGSIGVRLRAYSDGHAGGPWIDTNVGVAHTGEATRPEVDAHLGWDFRVSHSSRLDVGPFLGYTQIFQPDENLRGTDARILTAGISFSLGATDARRRAAPATPEAPQPIAPPPPPVEMVETIIDRDPVERVDVNDYCVTDCGIRIVDGRIQLDDIIHFEFGKAKVRGESFFTVQKLARFINAHGEIKTVDIEGHTDEVGTDEYNDELSRERATAMRELLLFFGAPAERLRTIGHGKTMPKVASSRAEQVNRRVELFVTLAHAEDNEDTKVSQGNAISQGKSSEH